MHIMPYHDDLMIFFSFTKIKVQPISSIIDALFFFFTQVLKYHGEMCVKTCFLPVHASKGQVRTTIKLVYSTKSLGHLQHTTV